MCLSKDYVYGLMTGLFAWISLDCFVVDFFCDNDQRRGFSLDKSASHWLCQYPYTSSIGLDRVIQ